MDDFVQSILESVATTPPDASLGSFIVASLKEQADYDNLLELVQEQCGVTRSQAEDCLQTVSRALTTTSPRVEQSLLSSDLLDVLDESASPTHPEQQQQDFNPDDDYWLEYLWHYQPDVSMEAATEALHVTGHDPALALALVSYQAPPICRHLLQHKCYRRDCQFSHDLDNHTCLFWLRGRCEKDPCPFRHGFGPGLVERLKEQTTPAQTTIESYEESYPAVGGGMAAATVQRTDQWTAAATSATTTTSYEDSFPDLGATPSTNTTPQRTSFANVASQGQRTFAKSSSNRRPSQRTLTSLPRVDIPRELWLASENRDPIDFTIRDPLERFRRVNRHGQANVMDLHYQSKQTFGAVLGELLEAKLEQNGQVWIITGTGHHVGRSHQVQGGTLEQSVLQWLVDHEYQHIWRGRDRNGQGGVLLVKLAKD